MRSGIGFSGLLTLIFIVLRLTDTTDWSWWWVLSPLWITFLVVILAFVGIFALAIRSENRNEKRRLERERGSA